MPTVLYLIMIVFRDVDFFGAAFECTCLCLSNANCNNECMHPRDDHAVFCCTRRIVFAGIAIFDPFVFFAT